MSRIKKKIDKFTIIGKGTAGCLTASFIKKHTNAEIDWIYDSNSPAQSVGEGSTIPTGRGLFDEINFNYTMLDVIGGSIKKGIRKVGWNGIGDYLHEFPMGSIAMHFSSKMLQDLIPNVLSKKGVNIIDKRVDSYDDLDTDHIIDCSGKPSDWTGYEDAEFIAVNAAHIVQSPARGPLFDYTFCVARPFGWIFAIPLAERTSCGYMYNDSINSLEEVKEDMKKFMEGYGFPYSEEQNNFSFKNYYKKENYSERVTYNGNASFFLEPLEATSVGTVDHINRRLLDSLRLDYTFDSSNEWYKKEIRETQHMIMMHYFAGSKYNNSFWDYAKQKGKESMEDMVESNKFRDIAALALTNYQDPNFNDLIGSEYGQWPAYSYLQNIKGLDIALKVDNMIREFETK